MCLLLYHTSIAYAIRIKHGWKHKHIHIHINMSTYCLSNRSIRDVWHGYCLPFLLSNGLCMATRCWQRNCLHERKNHFKQQHFLAFNARSSHSSVRAFKCVISQWIFTWNHSHTSLSFLYYILHVFRRKNIRNLTSTSPRQLKLTRINQWYDFTSKKSIQI